MGSLTARGRVAVVVAFVLSAGLASGAAVALVKASDEERTPGRTLPRVNPTLVPPSEQATPATTAAPTPSAAPTATAAPTASATAGPSSGPTPSASSSPKPRPAQGATYLSAKADLVPLSQHAFKLVIRATDGDDPVVLSSVTWGDGETAASSGGARCSAPAGADCRVFTLQHSYVQAVAEKTYAITVLVTAGKERVVLTLQATVAALPPAPTPTPTPSA